MFFNLKAAIEETEVSPMISASEHGLIFKFVNVRESEQIKFVESLLGKVHFSVNDGDFNLSIKKTENSWIIEYFDSCDENEWEYRQSAPIENKIELFKILLDHIGDRPIDINPKAWHDLMLPTPYDIFKQRLQEELIDKGWVQLYEIEELEEDEDQVWFTLALKLNDHNIQVISIPFPQEGTDINSSICNKFKRYGEDTKWNWDEFLQAKKLTELFPPEHYTYSDLQEYLEEKNRLLRTELKLILG